MAIPLSRSLPLALTLAACSRPAALGVERAPPPAFAPLPVAAPPPAQVDAAAPARGAFERLSDYVLEELLSDEPSTARDLGLHEYDGKVAPASAKAFVAQVARLKALSRELAAVDLASLDPDELLDRAELESWVNSRLFALVDLDGPRKRPQTYEDLFEVNVYVDREYASLEERAGRLLAQEQAALAEVPHVRENLAPPLSRPVAEVAARNFAGYAAYLRGDVVRLVGQVGDKEQRKRFAETNEALAQAAQDLARWLTKEAARGDQGHELGAARFAKLLAVQEGLSTPVDDLARMNEDDLAANRRAYEELALNVKLRPVPEAQLFATARRMVSEARAFVVDHAVVTLPSEDLVVVRETPPYQRYNAASIEMSGAFEAARSAFFQLTIPDKSWKADQRAAYLGSTGDLLGTTIHEVYPGHFVQGRWAERAPTRVQKTFVNYAFVEGWAHYAEQMMVDLGFGDSDPSNRLAMLHGALLRNCRFAGSIAMHTKGATVGEVEKRFLTDCHQDPATSHEQAIRATFDPGYFAYTLGKLQIRALRQEAEEKLGDRFSLERFHDALLSHGAPPIALIHDRVLAEIGAPR